MTIEIIVTTIIVCFAAYLFYKDFRKSTAGKCNCGSCSSGCPEYKKGHNDK